MLMITNLNKNITYLHSINIPKDLAIATFAKTATRGTRIIPDPNFSHISKNVYVSSSTVVVIFGNLKVGKPEGTLPK